MYSATSLAWTQLSYSSRRENMLHRQILIRCLTSEPPRHRNWFCYTQMFATVVVLLFPALFWKCHSPHLSCSVTSCLCLLFPIVTSHLLQCHVFVFSRSFITCSCFILVSYSSRCWAASCPVLCFPAIVIIPTDLVYLLSLFSLPVRLHPLCWSFQHFSWC